jgi:hypothetical protein
MNNPWLALPNDPPYVLESDREAIEAYNQTVSAAHYIHTELLPEPYVGHPDCKVLLLNLNPGYSKEDASMYTLPGYREVYLATLRHEQQEYPFHFLNPAFPRKCGFLWWQKRLFPIVKRLDGDAKLVAQSVCCIEYFPYHSSKFGRPPRLESQEYGFELARRAVRNGAVVVIMRGEGQWKEAVPNLREPGRYYVLRNRRSPYISPGNCPDGFPKIVEAIEPGARMPLAR